MANIAIFRINYKSDFILTLNSDAGWATPFCIKFWTGAPSQAYFVGFDGTTYTHCAPVDGEPTKLLVQFDDHHLPIGDLKFQIAYHFTVDDFPTSMEDEVINQASVIIEVDGEPAQVMLDLNGETAPEIQFSLPAYANEAQRIANEQARIAAEQQRIANEEARIAAETVRQQNEEQRIQHEEERVSDFARLKRESEAATTDANTAATLANEEAALAADKATLAQAAATLADEKAALAADKAALAQAAATLANEKAALAQQKAAYAQAQGDYANAQGDYAKEQGDYANEQGDYAKEQGTIAEEDHVRAESDHTRAESDHATAANDHTQAASDHTRAEVDHSTASTDHTTATNDHTQAVTDHATATSDHTQAGNDHTRAESDHTRAESDHAAVEVYVDSLGAFDISAYHATGGVLAKYADLTAALGTNGANIPDTLRKGGISVKFVQSSDNKYVQARLMANDFTTDETQWQMVDSKPTAGNENLVKGSGCNRIIYSNQLVNGYYSGNGKNVGDLANTSITASDVRKSLKFQVFKGEVICLYTKSSSGVAGYVRSLILTDVDNYITYLTEETTSIDYTQTPLIHTIENDGYAYIECDTDSVAQFKCYINKSSHLDYYIDDINIKLPNLLSNNNLLMHFIFDNSVIKNINNSNQLLKTGAIGNTAETEPTSFYNYGYIKESCNEGDVYYVSTQGGQNGRAYAFCDSNNIVLLSSRAMAAADGIIIAPKNTSYIVVNNDFTYQATPNLVKLNSGCIYDLYSLVSDMEIEIEGIVKSKDLDYDSYVTGYFINLNGYIQVTQQSNRQINTYSVTKGRYKITRNEGNSLTRGYRLLDMNNQVIALGPIGGTESMVTDYLDVNISKGKLEVFFLTVGTCEVTYVSKVDQALEPINEEISECNKKATNIGGLYLANNKILLCGASISTDRNAYFEYAMKVLGVQGANMSVAGTNIYYLAYRLYSNPSDFNNDDVLIISHIHNFNVFDLPSGKEAYSVSDYEGDTFLGDYIKTTDYYNGNLSAAGGYSADELYAIGYDYVLKKWAKICYDLKNTAGYNSVFGKPCQIVLYTYWHDARVAYNTSIRKLAKKWGFLLIKDDENIGFSKNQVNPATNQQWSILYGDTTGWAPTEVINGVVYGFHPDRMTDANYQLWQNSGVLLQSYLPYIQKIRAAILINTLKDAIIKPEQE